MKPAALALTTLLLGAPAVASEPPAGASVVFVFDSLKASRGEVMVALYDDQGAYKARKGSREARVRAAAGGSQVRFDALKPGRYAAMIFHDLNGDGRMNFAPMGVPLEPYAFSNNAAGRFGPAAWRVAAFEVPAGGVRQTIRLR